MIAKTKKYYYVFPLQQHLVKVSNYTVCNSLFYLYDSWTYVMLHDQHDLQKEDFAMMA